MAAVPPLGDSKLEDPISDELIVQKWLDSTNGQSDDVAPQKKNPLALNHRIGVANLCRHLAV